MADGPIPERVARLEQRQEDDHSQLQSLGKMFVKHAELEGRQDAQQEGLNQVRTQVTGLRDDFDEHLKDAQKTREEAKRFKLNAYIAVGGLVFAALSALTGLLVFLHGGG